jgi:hypothetical protein
MGRIRSYYNKMLITLSGFHCSIISKEKCFTYIVHCTVCEKELFKKSNFNETPRRTNNHFLSIIFKCYLRDKKNKFQTLKQNSKHEIEIKHF